MEQYSLVFNFFKSLMPHERKTLKNFLRMHERNNDDSLILKLNKCLSDDKQDYKKVLVELYGNESVKSLSAFRKLIERFRDRMYEAHCLDINIFNRTVASPFFAGVMEAKKMVSQTLGVIARGVPIKEQNRLLNKGIHAATKFEQYDELIILLKLKVLFFGFVNGFSKQKKIFQEIEEAIRLSNCLFESKKLIYVYLFDLQYKSVDEHRIKDEIRIAAERCQQLYKESGLHNIFYDWYSLEIQYCHYIYNYAKAEVMLEELIKYIQKHAALNQFAKIADSYMNLSRTQAFLYKYESAVASIDFTLRFGHKNAEVINLYNEQKSFLLIYLKKYDHAINLLKEIVNKTKANQIPAQYSLRKYLLAIVFFLQGDYKTAFKETQETKEIENDRDGWNIGIRLLHIFLTLETEKIDLADKRIESLRKHIERTVKMRSIRKRDVVIFRLLTHLSRSGFDFKEVWEERQKDFSLLRSNDPEYRWVPRSHEMILFDQWFESKVNNVPYEPRFPQPD